MLLRSRSPIINYYVKREPYMKHAFIFTFLLFSINCFAQSEWQFAQDTDGIEIYTKVNNETQLLSFKATVIINAPFNNVVASLHNAEEHTQWFHDRELTKILENKNNQDYIVYSVTSAPWPVQNRDAVISYNFSNNDDNTHTRIEVNHVDNYYPIKEEFVRVPYIKGYWDITKLDSNSTKLTFKSSASPGGNIPSWLANSGVIDMPYNSLYNLRERLQTK